MLVLSRRAGQGIVIGDRNITVTILEITGTRVRLGISGDRDITVHREELFDSLARVEDDRNDAAEGSP